METKTEFISKTYIEEIEAMQNILSQFLVMANKKSILTPKDDNAFSELAITFSEAKDYVLNVEKPALIHLVALPGSDNKDNIAFAKQQIKEFSRMFKI